jgi:alkylation response protein AidB-like acyl-CoA dehydrogenase
VNFGLTEDQERVREAVRDFAESEIAPGVAERERNEIFPREILRRLAEMGILGMMVPESYGGAGADALSYVLAIEELSRVCASTAVIVSVNNSVACYPIWKFGTERQKTTILAELASGRALGAYALTEPQSGSDAANQKTRAVRDGSGYVVNGAKAWITNAGEADWYVVMAMTDAEAGTRGITAFLVSSEDPGLRVGAPEDKMGLRASRTASIFLEDVRVPEERRLGGEGEGFTIAMTTLDHSRIGIAAQGIGIGQAAYDAAVEYARTRETFGRKLAEHEAIAFQIADMRVQLEAARVLTYRAALLSEKPGVRFSKESSMAKVYATEAANAIANRAVQIFGGYGYSKEYAVERYYRDARVTTIYEGTSEIQRIVIAKNVLAGR